MSCIEDLKEKFQEYENAMSACLPKVDKKLITELLVLMKKESITNVHIGGILKNK